MSFATNKQLHFIDSFKFLSSSLDSLVEKLSKNNLKYLRQEFYNNVLDLVKQKEFYPYKYLSDFENFKEELPSRENFYSPLTKRKITDNEYEHALIDCNKFEMKTMKYYHGVLRRDTFLLADVLKRFRSNSLEDYG